MPEPAIMRADGMRTVLLTRGGADARNVASVLAAAGFLDAVVVEDSAAARRGKIMKSFRGVRPWGIPAKALDVFALVVYGNWCEKVLARGLGVSEFPEGVTRVDIGSANDPESLEALRELRPDVLVVLGTGILKDAVLAIPTTHVLNIHGGSLPEFRGVYSDFWTLTSGDPGAVGSTIFHVDSGVDTGEVALAGRVPLRPWPTLANIKIENSRLRARLMVEALVQAQAGTLPRVSQPRETARTWYTPTGAQLIRGLWRIRRRRMSADHVAAPVSAPDSPPASFDSKGRDEKP